MVGVSLPEIPNLRPVCTASLHVLNSVGGRVLTGGRARRPVAVSALMDWISRWMCPFCPSAHTSQREMDLSTFAVAHACAGVREVRTGRGIRGGYF